MRKYSVLALLAAAASGFATCALAAPDAQAIPGVATATATVELVQGGFTALEGPVSDGQGGLYFNDVRANIAYRMSASGAITAWREHTGGANGQYRTPAGVLIVAEGSARRLVEVTPGSEPRALATAAGGLPLREPNDVIVDSHGGIYLTDPAPRPSPTESPKETGNLDFLLPAGEARVVDSEITRPNGLTLSLDERTLYVDDTEGMNVYAFDRQQDGALRNRRVYATLVEPEQGPAGLRSRADGMTIDSEGRLYVATAAGVQVIGVDGRLLGVIRTPVLVRNLAFSGPGRHVLYMTALQAIYRVNLLAAGSSTRSK